MKTSFGKTGLLLTILFLTTVLSEYAYPNFGGDSLKYFGHSFVQIITSEGKNIYIDPYGINEFKDSADVVLVTHEHSDHNDLTRIKQKKTCTVIRSANALKSGVYQNFTIGSINIKAVPAYNANHAKSSCVGYVVEFDGIKLYHAGDTGKITEMADLVNQNITYALIPIDGVYTMTPAEAVEAAAMIGAKYDIPIHTMPPPDTYSDANVDKFTSPNKLIVKPGAAIELNGSVTSVGSENTIPELFRLEQNYPNPFNPSTTIGFQLNKAGNVSLKIFDITGSEIALLTGGYMEPGKYSVEWNAGSLPSGVYLCRLESGNFSSAKKIMLLK